MFQTNIKVKSIIIVLFIPFKLILAQTYACELDTVVNKSGTETVCLNIYKFKNNLKSKLISSKGIISNSNLFSFQVQDEKWLWTLEAYNGTSAHDLTYSLTKFELKKSKVIYIKSFGFHFSNSIQLDNVDFFLLNNNLYFKYLKSNSDTLMYQYPLNNDLFLTLPQISLEWKQILSN